ncbi:MULTISPECIES: alkaline phosphatase D family protein [Pseudomonas]|uniref:Alkaline phosphatase D family protein n=3 Tax=Pseudomonas TaxID=286 RepID=A0A7W2QIV9_PSEPU|nr:MULTISPECIES: alkaline phosphatase D family protein [Pseudomonas]MBA6116247.1 alkaline phosphatase D family protein [Pseudomonas putida]MCZ9639128.1 alkaline phosphatase D family protein [Pseudomonas putida]
MSHHLHRRQALRLLAGAAAAPLLLRYGRALAGVATPFSQGVASGDPWPDGFVIWTRLSEGLPYPGNEQALPSSITVDWQVAADPDFRRIAQRGRTHALAVNGHAVQVELRGLAPDREYWYRFIALGELGPTGRTRTLPAPGAPADRLRIGVASCAHYERGLFSAYRHMAEERPDLVLFLGDYIYEYSNAPGTPGLARSYNAPQATDLAGYRYRYALHRTDPDLQALHAAAPWIATWDDHEVQDDYSGVYSKDPAIDAARFRQRRAAAYQAFLENMPLRRPPMGSNGSPLIYRRFAWGDLASLPVLDGRQYRSKQPCYQAPNFGKGHMEVQSCVDLADPRRTLLGFEQERWLYDKLKRSEARWNLLAQNLLVAPLRAQRPDGGEARYWTDTWDGYQAARGRLIDNLRDSRAANPVVLSGDYHSFWANHLHEHPQDPQSRLVAAEFVGTSITSNGPSYEAIQSILPANPQIRFYDSRPRGYLSLDLNRERLEVKMQAISDRMDPNATVSTLKRFVVEAGSPQVQEA